MEITEVRIKLMDKPEDRLRGFCSVTFDECFVIRDLKIIEGNRGPFVAMPSRKLTSNCHKCRSKNHLKSNYCNQCGTKLRTDNIEHDANGRAKLYADIAHPINSQCREAIQNRIVQELKKEEDLSRQPGYRSRYDEGYDDRTRSTPTENSRSSSAKSDDTADKRLSEESKNSDATPPPQSEVETRIDIPRPSPYQSSPHRPPATKATEASKSVFPHHPENTESKDDHEDTFGDGIF